MKAHISKLTVLVASSMAALAIVPGSASAWTLKPYCTNGATLTPVSSVYTSADLNADGYVCPKLNKAGNGQVIDNSYYLAW
jgi:hypothetical protein